MSSKQCKWFWGFVVVFLFSQQSVQGAGQAASHQEGAQASLSLRDVSPQDALSDLTIIVSSCDKYAPLWPVFSVLVSLLAAAER